MAGAGSPTGVRCSGSRPPQGQGCRWTTSRHALTCALLWWAWQGSNLWPRRC